MLYVFIMKTTVKKWGNSLGIRIAKTLAEESQIQEGSELNITTKNGNIILKPVAPKYDLDSLLKQVNKNNLHNEIEVSKQLGREEW